MSHTAHKVTVCCGNTSLTLCQNSHIAAQTRAAGRRADNSSRLYKDLHQPFSDTLEIDSLSGRNHDTAHSLCHLAPFQNPGGNSHIIDPSIRTGTDHGLVNPDLSCFFNGPCILGKMRECDCRFQFGQVDCCLLYTSESPLGQ